MAAKKKSAAATAAPENVGTIEARLAALRGDFDALQGDLKGLYGDVSEVASERAAQAMRSAEEVADRAMALAEEAAREATQTAREFAGEAEEWAEENADELRAHVRAQPLTSLLLAMGAGAFLGAIFLRR